MHETVLTIALVPVLAALSIVLGLFYEGIVRNLKAKMQSRLGPPVVQPFRDVRKLLKKEDVVPKNSVAWLFKAAPVLALITTLTIVLFLPIGGFDPLLSGSGDLVVVVYLLIFPSLALTLGGFSSSSTYPTVGGQREMVKMMSYELPLAVIAVSVAWLVSGVGGGIAAFSFEAMSENVVWSLTGSLGSLGLFILFIVALTVLPGKSASLPFDASKAKTELAEGAVSEYSGRSYALLYITDCVKMLVFATIVVGIFIPYGISGFLGLSSVFATVADFAFYLIKVFLVIFLGSVFARAAFSRLRITQIVKFYWVYSTGLSLLGLGLIVLGSYI